MLIVGGPAPVTDCSQSIRIQNYDEAFGFIHRDLKPANVAVGPVGTPQFRFLHIFDFGLAREYIVMPRTGPPKMRRPRQRAHFRGTLRYCSVNTHEKGEQGRDDDLWCLLYMLVELRGPLPWSKVRERRLISRIKRTIDMEKLLENCPVELLVFAEHLTTLNYYIRPNYALLYQLLLQVMEAGKIRHVPQSYGLKFDDVNAVLKALVEAITRRHVHYLEGGLGPHYSVISGAIGGTTMMEKLNKWIQFDYPPVFHSGSRPHFSLKTLWK
ncbi:hypothetical protein Y032_0930g3092 [Ancylostoma ceylanicum]|uniref:Protein kinase domain-containing protein n=1 Tax=Ancylostoma ceylanicum TaxID=53326 RepID=A0A016W963_9BILA|nr:hypothetical protein Y032_0930g3092 [Ancylostoma ceylanicum]